MFILICLNGAVNAKAADTPGIDDDTVITSEQAGSLAPSAGDYGWDSRGAVFDYYSSDRTFKGSLGEIFFCDRSGNRRAFLWDAWGMRFPDWWGRMLAERIRAEAPDDMIPIIRRSFGDFVTFKCTWEIAIGTKSSKAGGRLYKTLRNDDTLRVMNTSDLSADEPAEVLFRGDEMSGSLSAILKAEEWGTESQNTFAARNPYYYNVRIRSYDIDIRATNCITCAAKGIETGSSECTHVPEGKYLNLAVPIVYNGREYTGVKSFVWEGQTVTFTEPEPEGYVRKQSGDDLSGLKGRLEGSSITPSDASVIYLYYETEDSEDTPDDTQAPDGDDEGPDGREPGDGGTPGPGSGSSSGDNGGSPAAGTGKTGHLYDPAARIEIRSDTFDVSTAIPSTEEVWLRAEFAEYLYSLDAGVVSGRWPIDVTVRFPYTLKWNETDEETGEVTEQTESGSVSTRVTVYRDYSFIHLNSFAYSVPEKIEISNPALYPQNITVGAAEAGIVSPKCGQPVVYGGANIGGNINLPSSCPRTITAGTVIIDGGDSKPSAPSADRSEALSLAEAAVGRMRCRNDEITFGGRNALGTSGWHAFSGAEKIDTGVFTPGRSVLDSRKAPGRIYIPAQKRNGTYQTSGGRISYRPAVTYNASISYPEEVKVNPVKVHTPVICELKAAECDRTSANSRYVQEPVIDGSVLQAVIGSPLSYGLTGHEYDSCDLYLYVSNRGNHPVYSDRLGSSYDLARNVSGLEGGSYIRSNEIYFPFDVWMDVGNDRNISNDRLLKAGKWYEVAAGSQRYYIPDTVKEGDYVIEARTRAVNSTSRSDMVSKAVKNGRPFLYANSDPSDHVSADSLKIHVSGKMYGLKLTGISSDAEWKQVFEADGKKKLEEARTGAGLSDGTLKISLPDGLARGSILKKNYFYYSVGTDNELGLPTGRHPKFVLPMLAGCTPDASMVNVGMPKAGYSCSFELYTTGNRTAAPGSYIAVEPRFRWVSSDGRKSSSYTGTALYYSGTIGGKKVQNVRLSGSLKAAPSEAVGGDPALRRWRFDFSLPAKYTVYADGKLCRDGYLFVGFLITAYDASGNVLLSYDASGQGGCDMWSMEGQELHRTDHYGRKFDIMPGEVLIYDIAGSKADDYLTDHKY